MPESSGPDPDATGAALDPVRLPDLSDLPEVSGLAELANLLQAPPADPPAAPTAAPTADETPTAPRLELARPSSVWLWLWGPLLAAVLVVSFLAGMASAPMTVPAVGTPHPASVTDVDGRLLATVDPPAGSEQIPADQVPDLLLRTVVAIQDPGYFSRTGLSATDLVRAGAADLVRVRRHGTTIEERYAHQVRVAGGSHLPSLRESTVAARLAQKLSRRALLARYVNGMYFGNGVYGVGPAARYYFGVPVAALDPAELAMLAGIGDDPSHSNPVTAPALAIAAQQRVIDAMRARGLLTAEQAAAARREPIDARAHRQLERPSPAPDFTALVESSLLSRFGDDAVYGQDLRVQTPLDLDLQTALSDTVQRLVPSNVPAVLALATDPRTGDIRAMLNRSATSSASGAEGASDVLFTRRPLGSLAAGLPVPVGDGTRASLGEVATTVGALTTDGMRRDLRPLTAVTRPAGPGLPAETLDRADPVPPGRFLVDSDRAQAVSRALRASARTRGSVAAGLPFLLTAVSGSVDAPNGPGWYVGCLPELCLTVWTGDGAQSDGQSDAHSDGQSGDLAGSIVVGTLQRYIAAAPGRVTLPAVPQPRPSVPAAPARPVPTRQQDVAPPVRPAAPSPRATGRTPSAPRPSGAPTVAASSSVAPSATTGGTTDKGTTDGAPVAQPGPVATGGSRPGT